MCLVCYHSTIVLRYMVYLGGKTKDEKPARDKARDGARRRIGAIQETEGQTNDQGSCQRAEQWMLILQATLPASLSLSA